MSNLEGWTLAAPIITLMSDFGLQDGYVASMKGVILGIAPDALLVDISHEIPPQDIRSAAFVLSTCYACFPQGTVHLAVVDPGVGTERKAIAVRSPVGFFVGPDNGIFSLVLGRETRWEARSLENCSLWRKETSATFHGRDIFAPVAARLARGVPFDLLGPLCSPAVLEWSSPIRGESEVQGEIIHIDRFGNCITNVAGDDLMVSGPLENWTVRAGGVTISSILNTYGQSRPGSVLALNGSSGYIEIAINQGNAASELGLSTGTRISLSFAAL
jgi:S-adenosyl-L-methionine hydrolase (adenosine-forming)